MMYLGQSSAIWVTPFLLSKIFWHYKTCYYWTNRKVLHVKRKCYWQASDRCVVKSYIGHSTPYSDYFLFPHSWTVYYFVYTTLNPCVSCCMWLRLLMFIFGTILDNFNDSSAYVNNSLDSVFIQGITISLEVGTFVYIIFLISFRKWAVHYFVHTTLNPCVSYCTLLRVLLFILDTL